MAYALIPSLPISSVFNKSCFSTPSANFLYFKNNFVNNSNNSITVNGLYSTADMSFVSTINSVSATAFSYIKNLTSDLQTQIANMVVGTNITVLNGTTINSPTINGTIVFSSGGSVDFSGAPVSNIVIITPITMNYGTGNNTGFFGGLTSGTNISTNTAITVFTDNANISTLLSLSQYFVNSTGQYRVNCSYTYLDTSATNSCTNIVSLLSTSYSTGTLNITSLTTASVPLVAGTLLHVENAFVTNFATPRYKTVHYSYEVSLTYASTVYWLIGCNTNVGSSYTIVASNTVFTLTRIG